jgi:hypothetical protein
MKKGNVIDLIKYREELEARKAKIESRISEELQKAIRVLIQKLRESGPASQTH